MIYTIIGMISTEYTGKLKFFQFSKDICKLIVDFVRRINGTITMLQYTCNWNAFKILCVLYSVVQIGLET